MSFRKTSEEVLRIIVRGGAVIDVVETLGRHDKLYKVREKETGGIAEVANDEYAIFVFKEESIVTPQRTSASIFGK